MGQQNRERVKEPAPRGRGGEHVALFAIRLDDAIQPRCELDRNTVEEYAAELTVGATFPAVVVFRDAEGEHWLADGFHRWHAHRTLGRESIAVDVREGSRRDAMLHAAGANAAHGLRRTNADKRRAVAMLLEDEEWSEWSDREIARRCGVTHPLVARIRASLETATSEDEGARRYTTRHGTPAVMQTKNIGRSTTSESEASPEAAEPAAPLDASGEDEAPEAVDDEQDARGDAGAELLDVDDSERGAPLAPVVPISQAAGYDSDEWYTPPEYVEAAREVMGAIDLDPASCEHAQATIQAERFHTKADDGLAQEWHGRVWLNPPYSQPAATRFADKLLEEHAAGRVTEAVMVQNAGTDTVWFHRMAAAGWVCLVKGRINFLREDGSTAGNRYAQVFFYLGERPERFAEVFGRFGLVGQLRSAS